MPITQTQQEVITLEDKRDQLIAQIASEEQKFLILKKEVIAQTCSLEMLEKRKVELEGMIKILSAQIKELDATKQVLLENTDKAREEYSQLQQKIHIDRDLLEQDKAEINSIKEKITSLQDEQAHHTQEAIEKHQKAQALLAELEDKKRRINEIL